MPKSHKDNCELKTIKTFFHHQQNDDIAHGGTAIIIEDNIKHHELKNYTKESTDNYCD